MQLPIIGKEPRARVTERLRLEPITGDHAEDYSRVFRDDAVAEWYAGKATRAEAQRDVDEAERIWHSIGVHKWLVYERASGMVVGRGGLSVMHLDAHDGAIRSFLPSDSWRTRGSALMGPHRSRAGGRRSAGLYAVRTGGVATPRRLAVQGSYSRLRSSTCGRWSHSPSATTCGRAR